MKGFKLTLLIPVFLFHLASYAQIESESLISDFTAEEIGACNKISWVTATESNIDYYLLEKSTDGICFELLTITNGACSSSHTLEYYTKDYEVKKVINYYRLSEFNMDGLQTIIGMVSIDNRLKANLQKEIAYKTNIMNQKIDDTYSGIVIIIYTDNSFIRTIQ